MVMAFMGVGLIFIGIVVMICYPINKKKNARCSAQIQGMLVDIRKRNHGYWYFYSYEVNGTVYAVKSPNCSPEANEIGDNCTIWYDPSKPEYAQPFRYESNKVYNIILIIGIAMVLLGIFLTMFGLVKSSL